MDVLSVSIRCKRTRETCNTTTRVLGSRLPGESLLFVSRLTTTYILYYTYVRETKLETPRSNNVNVSLRVGQPNFMFTTTVGNNIFIFRKRHRVQFFAPLSTDTRNVRTRCSRCVPFSFRHECTSRERRNSIRERRSSGTRVPPRGFRFDVLTRNVLWFYVTRRTRSVKQLKCIKSNTIFCFRFFFWFWVKRRI